MNSLIEKNIISQMECGTNFAFVLNESSLFLSTEYKVLQSQINGCFIKTMKMLLNGHVELFYLTNSLKPFSSIISSLDSEGLIKIISGLFKDLIDVKNNGFLSCKNIDVSFEKIYVDPTTYKVSLVYLPLNRHVFDDDLTFENELRSGLVKLILGISSLNTSQTTQLSADLQNGSMSIEEIYGRLCGKGFVNIKSFQKKDYTENPVNTSASMKLISMNAKEHIEISVTKPEFIVGKKASDVDGVISFNKMISRVHCKIIISENGYFIIDLQSANGTYVNRVKLQSNNQVPLKNGDVVRLANSDFQVVIE